MLSRFFPDYYLDSVYQIPYTALRASGIFALIFDIDNTLAPFDMPDPSAEVVALFSRIQAMGFHICLLSNNSETRVAGYNAGLNLPYVSRARKPSKNGIRRALSCLSAQPWETALIGDQVFTDIWGGNRAGLTTILVKPMSHRDELTVKLKRGLEKCIVNAYIKRSGNVCAIDKTIGKGTGHGHSN